MASATVSSRSKNAKAGPSVHVSDRTIAGLSEVFKLLSDKARLKILLALSQNDEMHVTALCALLNQSQPAVSHHLTLLRMAGLVGYRRDGKHNFYYLDSTHVRDLLDQFFADAANGSRQLQFSEFSLTYKPK